MVGVLFALLVSCALVGVGDLALRKITGGLDAALRIGASALIGLAVLGFGTWALAMIGGPWLKSGLLIWMLALVGVGVYGLAKAPWRLAAPKGPELGAALVLALAVVLAAIAAAGPSDALDWDSLAYHLAAPKIWLHAGKIVPISFMHHSNFPSLVDSLFLNGLANLGPAMAKGFMTAYLLWGCVALFGFARAKWGSPAGWLAALIFAGAPTVLWESGTAYIDVAHGLYAGLGTLFVAESLVSKSRHHVLLAGLFLGCGAASKYTGLQTIVACGVVALVVSALRKEFVAGLKSALVFGTIGFVMAAPWLIKNQLWVGNPVYPFLYERFGGANWNQFSADIYRDEQQSFGVGRTEKGRDVTQIGHAAFGLGYQPGRYVNPRQTEGGGFPIGALGAAVVAAGALALATAKRKSTDLYTLAILGVCVAMWFFLSQQSRYLVSWIVPLAVMAGGLWRAPKWGAGMTALGLGQMGYTLWLVVTLSVAPKAPVVFGSESEPDYHSRSGPAMALAAPRINAVVGSGRVALFDEVFGYYLDVDYFWANPGHSTEIPYAELSDAKGFVNALRALRITHVYYNMSLTPKPMRDKWAGTAGLLQSAAYTDAERKEAMRDPRSKWPVLLAEATLTGQLKLVDQLPGGLLFEVSP